MTINRERSIDTLLLEWKNSRSLKSLLLRGARQVGKSWAVEHLGESFDYFIEVNFEKRPDRRTYLRKCMMSMNLPTALAFYTTNL